MYTKIKKLHPMNTTRAIIYRHLVPTGHAACLTENLKLNTFGNLRLLKLN